MDLFDLDLVTILAAYLFWSCGGLAAGFFAFGQGFLIDIFSGGMHGLFTSIYLVSFGGVYLGSLFFNLQDPRGQFVIIFLAVLLTKIVFLIILKMFAAQVTLDESSFWMLGASTVGTGLAAPVLFYLLNRMKPAVAKGRQEASEGI
jgi:hypothetical protein